MNLPKTDSKEERWDSRMERKRKYKNKMTNIAENALEMKSQIMALEIKRIRREIKLENRIMSKTD